MDKKLNLDQKLKNLPAFFEDLEEVETVFLFGSYGTELQTVLSDIDFAIFFKKVLTLTEEMSFLTKLSECLGTDKVDLVNLNKAPIIIQFKAISEGKIIYERDFIKTSDYLERVMGIYQDYAIDLHFFYKEYDAALKEAYSNGR